MSLESNIADLVSASTQLTQAVNITRAEVDSKQASAAQAATDIVAVKDAVVTAAGQAATSASQAATSLTTTVSDYAAQKVTKGLAAIQTSAEQELADQLHRRDPARHPFRGAKPSLVLDFVRQECHRQNGGELEQVDLNSFMTFTRSSTATYTGPDGLLKTAAVNQPRYEYDPVTGECLGLLIEEQRTNLVVSLALPPSTGWKVGNTPAADSAIRQISYTSPSGLLDAYLFTPDVSGNTPNITAANANRMFIEPTVANGVYTASIYVRSFGGVSSACALHILNYQTDNSLASTSHTSTNEWTKITVTGTTNGVMTGVRMLFASSYPVLVYGPQLEAGAFPTSYIPTPATFTGRASTKTYFDSNGVLQTAASGVAVTDYGYVDGRWVSKGLSLEGAATNVALYSSGNNFSAINGDTTVTVSGSTINGVGLTRYTGADRILRRMGFFATALGTSPVTISFYVKKQSGAVIVGYAPWEGSTGDPTTIILNTATGAATLVKNWRHASAVHTITDCGTLWRVSLSVTYASGNYTVGTLYFDTNMDVTIGGFQAETGSVATSYIPTTTAQVTRAADTATSAQVTRAQELCYATTSTFYNHEEGVLFTSITNRVDNPNGGGVAYFYSSGVDPTHFNSFGISDRSNKVGFGSLGGLGVFNRVAGNFVVNTLSRSAIAYNATRFVAARNNALSADAIAVKRFRKIDRISVGTSAYKFNTKECLNGCIRLVVYYPKSLSNTDLQALTIL